MTEFKINAIEKCTKDLINKGFIEKMKANGDIVYTETFYKEMNRLMNSGKSSVECSVSTGPCRQARMPVTGPVQDTGSLLATALFHLHRLKSWHLCLWRNSLTTLSAGTYIWKRFLKK